MNRPALRARRPLLALLAVVVAASIVSPATGEEPVAGSAGTDTSLPATGSQVTVSGRGPFADLLITVNQTRDLVNQAISVSWTGAIPTTRGSSRFNGHYLQLMQCWGDDDEAIPTNPGPPPEQCVQGATDAVYGGRNAGLFPAGGYALERIISRGDFANFDPADGYVDDRTTYTWMPFRAVDGTTIDAHYDPDFNPAIVGGNYWLNPYFNAITTNEIAAGRTGVNGSGAELFEVATGLESSGLGCGQKAEPVTGGSPKAPRCWLVIVPRGDPAAENAETPFPGTSGVYTSPLSPAAWQHRIAIPLEFTALDSSCNLADDQRRISGNELPVPAVSSWQQRLCATPGLPPYAYGTIGDATARQQLLSAAPGTPGMVVVSRPIDPSMLDVTNPVVYGPLSLSGTVIGFNIERTPRSAVIDPAEENLRSVRVAELNLTPRLVAKLLTQSYRSQTEIRSPSPYQWATGNPPQLARDPDFLQFNPEFELLENGGKNLGGLVMPSRNSDAALQVWEWVLADPEAKAWLGGAPDFWGMKVNPAYAAAAALNSSGAAFGDPIPDQYPKSDPYCFQAPAQGLGGTVVPPPLCGTDWLPYTQSLRDAARLTRVADDGARTFADSFATSSDKVYRSDGPQTLGSRSILSLTDSASAYQYGVQMARLSRAGDDGADRTFIAPDESGLTAGVEAMTLRAGTSVREPDPSTTHTGGYPLTALTYAAIAPLSLDEAARNDYASFLEYAAGPGQVLGREVGQLPPGYASLPGPLRAETLKVAKVVRDLRAPADPVAGGFEPLEMDAAFSPAENGSSTPFTSDAGDQALSSPTAGAPVEPTDPSGTPKATGLATPIVALAGNRLALPGLAVIALLAALGILEITKRPRRLPAGTVAPPGRRDT